MATLRVFQRTSRASARAFSSTSNVAAKEAASNPFAGLNARCQDTAKQHRQFMLKKPLNPHLTNTTSTIANAFPSLGEDKPPADQLTSANPDFLPKDSVPENQERMTGGTQAGGPKKGPNAELDVGEIEGGTFKVEPHKRTGEKERDMRARLLYQSRKRGTLESDLLCSTFAAKHLPTMTMSQMQQYDLFLDENDWDIYYWATQDPSQQYTEPQVPLPGELQAGKTAAEATADGSKKKSKRRKPTPEEKEDIVPGLGQVRAPSPAEWSGTVGTFKPAYRPVPARWKSSEILSMLRKHVMENSAGGVHEEHDPKVGGEGLSQAVQGTGGKGLGFMPELKPMD